MDNEAANKIAAATLAGQLMQKTPWAQTVDSYAEVYSEFLTKLRELDKAEKQKRSDENINRILGRPAT